jgi:hypothetical protein
LLNTFKGIAKANFGTWDTILLWTDLWNGSIMQHTYPHLYSFAKDNQVTVKTVLELDSLEEHFHLPLLVEAHQQFCELDISLQSLQRSSDKDK